jgi:hypothetical protein
MSFIISNKGAESEHAKHLDGVLREFRSITPGKSATERARP